jgi:hypothetical protein
MLVAVSGVLAPVRGGGPMSVLPVVDTRSCGSERPYNAFRLAHAHATTMCGLAEATVRRERVLSF